MHNKKRLTKRAPDAGDSAHISSSFLRLSLFLAGRLRRPRPSAGNANRWAARHINMTEQTKTTLMLCLISAIFCGFLLAGEDCGVSNASENLRGECHIMAMNIPTKLQTHWINWVPGILFGIAFALGNSFNKFGIVAFSLVSGIIYYIAGLIFALFGIQLNFDEKLSWIVAVFATGSVFAGVFGATSLLFLVKYLSKAQIVFGIEIRMAGVGALAGIIFFFCGLLGLLAFPFWLLAFAIWQVFIGFYLTTFLQKGSIA